MLPAEEATNGSAAHQGTPCSRIADNQSCPAQSGVGGVFISSNATTDASHALAPAQVQPFAHVNYSPDQVSEYFFIIQQT